ncbi:hypothetical protein M3J09_002063 [Ascochyta lentis]
MPSQWHTSSASRIYGSMLCA